MDTEYERFFKKISLYIKVFSLENMTGLFFIFKFVLMVGYYNEFTVVRIKMVSKLFLKKIKNCDGLTQWALVPPGPTLLRFCLASRKFFQEINPMDLISSLENSLEIISFKAVKKFLGINPMGLLPP